MKIGLLNDIRSIFDIGDSGEPYVVLSVSFFISSDVLSMRQGADTGVLVGTVIGAIFLVPLSG